MEENLSQANETSAGESGKGFAVVAGQIGMLAEETKKLITKNNAQADETLPKLQLCIDVIKSLVTEMESINEKVATIAATTEEIAAQSQSLQKMSDDIAENVKLIKKKVYIKIAKIL